MARWWEVSSAFPAVGRGSVVTVIPNTTTTQILGSPPSGQVRFIQDSTIEEPGGIRIQNTGSVTNFFTLSISGTDWERPNNQLAAAGDANGQDVAGAGLLVFLTSSDAFSATLDNTPTGGDVRFLTSFIDIALPSTVTVVTINTNGTTPIDLIAAPPSGKARKTWALPWIGGFNHPHYFNADDITHGFETKVDDGVNPVATRINPASFGVTQNSSNTLESSIFLTGTQKLTFELTEATNTTEGRIFLAYETVDL